MNKGTYTVLITAAGVGPGLGEFAEYTNKTLIRVGHKPAISHIIESYPRTTEFVITLGHFGKQVKDFLILAYPKISITFIEVDKYIGKGSSMGHSMLAASKYLQKPFVYHASDTIVTESIPKPSQNWIGGFNGIGSSNYTSFNIINNKIQKIMEKGIIDPDFLHIGLVGIYDYKLFWKTLKKLHEENTFAEGLSDFHAFNAMIASGIEFKVKEFFHWYDVGNIDALREARKHFNDPFHVLEKAKESIFVLDSKVIKFFSESKNVSKRVKRAQYLPGLVPKLRESSENFYSYDFVQGDLLADVAMPVNFPHFLNWSVKHLWQPVKEVSQKEFKTVCRDFYETKTKERVAELLTTRRISDTDVIINGESVPSVGKILKEVDFDWLSDTEQTTFHGDFILDNIIKTKSGYTLLDWRQDFGGLMQAGDKYYDLAKLNHNLTVNHAIVNDNLFTVDVKDDKVICDILRKESLVQCQKIYHKFLAEENLDLRKVKVLTGIIWLNMSPLHHHPFDLFLFYFGRLSLWKALHEA